MSGKRTYIKFWPAFRFVLKQLDYSHSIIRSSNLVLVIKVLKEKVTPKSLLFLSSPVESNVTWRCGVLMTSARVS